MHVGVFPLLSVTPNHIRSLPHACGGVSVTRGMIMHQDKSSPCMWGCFPVPRYLTNIRHSLPHACGGVSPYNCRRPEHAESSPCMWGCFYNCCNKSHRFLVFPMHVGVFPTGLFFDLTVNGLPHACGGVSISDSEGAIGPGLPHACGGVSIVLCPAVIGKQE